MFRGKYVHPLIKYDPKIRYDCDFDLKNSMTFFQAGSDKRVNNFGKDISDSEAYTHLIHQISPKEAGVHKNALNKSNLMERAEETLEQADKIGCRSVIIKGLFVYDFFL